MAANIFVAASWNSPRVSPAEQTLLLEDDGNYWHLYRYFEGANLRDRPGELVDLYGGAEIDGYQLDRLEDEMKSAIEDAVKRPEEWRVLTGWNSRKARANEIWKVVERDKLIAIVNRILGLIALAREKKLKLIVSGD
jgi:hypothetical protein